MPNVLIIHGTGANPESNWFPWLKGELEKLGCNVYVPHFPTPKNHSLESWLKVFENYKKYLNKETIVIGHSSGPAFLLNVLEKMNPKNDPIHVAFFVAGFTGTLNNPEFNTINKTICNRTFNWESIKKNCRKFHIISSDNDPYVPLEKGKQLANNLNTELKVLKNAGHINSESGYTKFDTLLNMVKVELP